jgi:tRNA-2-methylthio-N6-dimethylallyladenosine synthase
MNYYLWNSGCQMNRADADRLAQGLELRGLRPTRDPRRAAILVLNTCVVRQSAEDRALGRMLSLKPLTQATQPRALLVMGCLVDEVDALRLRYPFVGGFFRPSDLDGLLGFVDGWLARCYPKSVHEGQLVSPVGVADMVPISYGCDHHCTYCIVTLRRGPQRSRPVGEIVADVEQLVGRGAREITLLGQNVDAYGTDLPERPDLADILEAIHEIPDLWRIRFLTSHPREMSPRIIERVAHLAKVCPCWELAVQSGDDAVLQRMGRGYTIARFRDLVAHIRRATPGCAINTDIIVGFCGETEAGFAHTVELLEATRFDVVHVASYSVRPGTPAAAWPDDVPPAIKDQRRVAIELLQERIAGEINAQHLGQTVGILVDGRQKGRWRGRTRSNKLVFFESDQEWLGRMAQVRVQWTGPWSMIGEVASTARPGEDRSEP